MGTAMSASSDDCSGHGTPVPEGRCICDPAWTGATDYFNLRVPSGQDGVYEALDCPVPTLGAQLVWCLAGVATLIRFGFALKALSLHLRKHGWRSKVSVPLALIVTDIVITVPVCIAALVLKILDSPSTPHVLGTDVAVSVLFALSNIFILVPYALFEAFQFRTLLLGGQLNYKSASTARGLVQYNATQFLLVAIYIGVNMIPRLVPLGMDQSQGPISDGEWVIIIVGNLGQILWQVFNYLGGVMMKRTIAKISSDHHASAAHRDADRLSKVLEALTEHTRAMRSQIVIFVVLYTSGALPWLWRFQTFYLALAASVLIVKMSPCKVLVSIKSVAVGTVSSMASFDARKE